MRPSIIHVRCGVAALPQATPEGKKQRLDMTATLVHPWPRHAVNLQPVVAIGARPGRLRFHEHRLHVESPCFVPGPRRHAIVTRGLRGG
jgi:hypothetical protein